jgi:hypothetical protein
MERAMTNPTFNAYFNELKPELRAIVKDGRIIKDFNFEEPRLWLNLRNIQENFRKINCCQGEFMKLLTAQGYTIDTLKSDKDDRDDDKNEVSETKGLRLAWNSLELVTNEEEQAVLRAQEVKGHLSETDKYRLIKTRFINKFKPEVHKKLTYQDYEDLRYHMSSIRRYIWFHDKTYPQRLIDQRENDDPTGWNVNPSIMAMIDDLCKTIDVVPKWGTSFDKTKLKLPIVQQKLSAIRNMLPEKKRKDESTDPVRMFKRIIKVIGVDTARDHDKLKLIPKDENWFYQVYEPMLKR